MPLPANFSGSPHEELHRYFRNLCHEFKKMVKTSKKSLELQQQMDQFIDTSKQMDWHHKNTGVYHKEAGDKATNKVWTEFKRYVLNIETANPQDLLDAIGEVERLINSLKTT
jgi:hypothetical protein